MKPGDLVKLVSDDHSAQVYVAAIGIREQRIFNEGTSALFLDEHHWLNERGHEKKLRILVDGRVGWIYESKCEVINETG